MPAGWPYCTIPEVAIASHPALNLGDKAYHWHLPAWEDINYASDVLPLRTSSNRILVAPLFTKPTR